MPINQNFFQLGLWLSSHLDFFLSKCPPPQKKNNNKKSAPKKVTPSPFFWHQKTHQPTNQPKKLTAKQLNLPIPPFHFYFFSPRCFSPSFDPSEKPTSKVARHAAGDASPSDAVALVLRSKLQELAKTTSAQRAAQRWQDGVGTVGTVGWLVGWLVGWFVVEKKREWTWTSPPKKNLSLGGFLALKGFFLFWLVKGEEDFLLNVFFLKEIENSILVKIGEASV